MIADLSMKDFAKEYGATITSLKVDMVWVLLNYGAVNAPHMANQMAD
jgi:hypothetical protein